ncbi:integrase core domain-containing protein [Jiangella anatolica]|uniref:Integrase catalytic domain-containing protein n=1 Tax=Jiangella anatolica TaxID=2670374 RepID=A0A2W2B8M5_9ACTN|nr:hypothetical protein C1I92_16900 [Jiangella anatolica]
MVRVHHRAAAYDNALAESQIGIYKTELIRPEGPWRDLEHVEIETLNWVHWFNHERTHASVDDLTAPEAETAHFAARNRPPGAVHPRPPTATRYGSLRRNPPMTPRTP